MESLGAPKVILEVLGLYKPSAPDLSRVSNSLVKPNLNELEKRIEEVGFHCDFSSLELIKCT
jgi:hypothetical protein